MTRLVPSLLVCVSIALAAPVAADPVDGVQVVAGPDDVLSGRLRLPDPATILHRSRGAWFPVEHGTGRTEWPVPVDAAGPLSIVAVSADVDAWDVRVRAGEGAAVSLRALVAAGAAEGRTVTLDGPLAGARAERFDLPFVAAGTWTVAVDAAPGARGGLLGVAGAGSLRLAAHLTSHALFDDGSAGVSAFVYDASDPELRPEAGAVARATLVLEVSGAELFLPMAKGDGGVFTARVPAGVRGDVRARVEVRGRTESGAAFARDALLGFPLVAREAVLDGTVAEDVLDDGALRVELAVAIAPGTRLHASAEVWGTGPSGAPVPVAWLSRIAAVDDGAVSFEIDAALLAAAGAAAPLELRRVRLQNPDKHVPYDRRARVPLAGTPAATPQATIVDEPTSTAVGKIGPIPRALLLVHGYCSGGVWPLGDFTQPYLEFLDTDQNRTNDEFAQLLLQFGADLETFGVVAHSQGGLAALHLATYYASGLDHAAGGRVIQSVGSPYLGTPLAPLGDIVPGVGCGANFDMSPDGAALWLAGIPSAKRALVHYYTTSETSFFACNVLTDFLLDDPNDGVVEYLAGQLPGANDEGHTTGWCHTTGMAQSAQYTDHVRNVVMNALAAR